MGFSVFLLFDKMKYMSAIPKQSSYSIAEYLALEEKAAQKHEFENGQIIPTPIAYTALKI